MTKPLTLAEDFIVLSPEHAATTVKFTPVLFEHLARDFGGFRDHVLVSSFAFDADWPSWERHPAGDEIVILVSGRATLVLETDSGERSTELISAGDYVIVPRNTWHTARTREPTRMFFITPGEGTENRE